MQSRSPKVKALALAVAGAVALATAAAVPLPRSLVEAAEKEKPKTRRVQLPRPKVFKKLKEIHELLAAEQFTQVLEKLNGMKDDKLNERETALVWQAFGFAYASMERYGDATEAWERCVATQGLHEAQELNIRYNLAQLYMVQDRFPEAIRTLQAWFNDAENPQPGSYMLMSQAYVSIDDYDQALVWAEQGVARANEPRESWLQLLVALYFDKKRYTDVARVLEQLVAFFPKKQYWMQLTAAYSELGEEKKALAVMELAHLQELLSKSSEVRRLAQLYLYHEIPYKCATVLAIGLDSGLVDNETDNWRLLADCWISAREYTRAVEPLQKAARLSDNGELYVRLAQVWFEDERWRDARGALQRALEKGDLKDACHAQLLLGIARYNTGQVNGARQAFQRATRCDSWRRPARQWLRHIESESSE